VYAATDGLLCYQRDALVAANSVCEDITLSVLPENQWVLAGRMIASAKIIPFAVTEQSLSNALALAENAALSVVESRSGSAVLIQTTLSSVKVATLDKTKRVTEQRLESRSYHLANELRCDHTTEDLCACLLAAKDLSPEIILIVGASAISDRRDVLPAAVDCLGGTIRRVGLPVDPGNLLMLADIDGLPILGLPGCARSPKHNGFDLLLNKIVCGQVITDDWLNGLCIGGLLDEVHDRPQPRIAVKDTRKVAALILGAGSSQRFGTENKLLHHVVDAKPMICSVVEAVLGSSVSASLLVTGHEAKAVEDAVSQYAIDSCHSPGYAGGLANSLAAGISRLQGYDAVLVCLADMPHVSSDVINQITSAHADGVTDKIVIPVFDGRRGNPVMIGQTFFDSLLQHEGDSGARYLVNQYPEKVLEVEVDSDSVLRDYDTQQALQE